MARTVGLLSLAVILFFTAAVSPLEAAEPVRERFEANDFESRLFLDWLYQDVGPDDEVIFSASSHGSAEKELIEKVLGQIESEAHHRGEDLSDRARSEVSALRQELTVLAEENASAREMILLKPTYEELTKQRIHHRDYYDICFKYDWLSTNQKKALLPRSWHVIIDDADKLSERGLRNKKED